MKLYEKLSALRKSHNYTQEQIASKLNVTRQTVSKWEMGLSEPSLDLLDKLADIYGCSVDELMGRDETNNAPTEPPAENVQSTDTNKSTSPFWSIYKEAFFVIIIGVIITVIYCICYKNLIPQPSILLFFVIECPIYLFSTIITAICDESIKTKKGLLILILPLLCILCIQVLFGLVDGSFI
ncbi:MAG: helix-turn-helix domain-containing protein [Clostridiales bacterium]|nr:helix-turn-helix domain-containing protein [Clostridiales bacterium]